MPVPPEMLAPMGAMVAALVLFAGLLQFGLFVVRRLKLPQDLPEGPHFEPPPPPVRDVLEPAAARAQAAIQARRRLIYACAHSAARAAASCAEASLLSLVAGPGTPDPATASTELARLAATAKAAADAADQAMSGSDLDTAAADTERHMAEAVSAFIATQAVLAPFPAPANRRLRWLLIVLGVMIAWMVLMFGILPRT